MAELRPVKGFRLSGQAGRSEKGLWQPEKGSGTLLQMLAKEFLRGAATVRTSNADIVDDPVICLVFLSFSTSSRRWPLHVELLP